ncbi:MAG: hydrogenase nickel incorporation protein HypB [Actinobacteria bacterium]|nr:hydrogenase nickel incorporation protein HypB [Actinomycetota bacterium]
MKIDVVENVMQYNKEEADKNRNIFKKNRILVLNLLSAPGAGKTSLIIETIKKLKDRQIIGVIEGDISSTHDAEKIKNHIDNVVQINTGGTCHLNASMVAKAIEKLDLAALDIIFIENVGNLICPVGFDLGEGFKVLVSSVTEGDDKPVKYPKAFTKADIIVLNKIDMIDYNDFNYDFFEINVKKLNPGVNILKVSCKKDTGLEEWVSWIKSKL